MAKVVVAMSGGVDSSIAAWLLKQQGHEVVGLFMRLGHPEPASHLPLSPLNRPRCCSFADAADAQHVARRLDIPFYVLNFEDEFRKLIDYFIREYLRGRTPNPCIRCNSWLKFGRLFEYADSIGADWVATGHYARLVQLSGEQYPALCRAVDAQKDQSYVLFGIDRHALHRVRFPVGQFTKEQIRSFAAQLGLPVADKPDSQEICFVPDDDYAAFIRRQRPDLDTAGPIVTTDGRVVGQHDGYERFTVGQRKGLRLAMGERYFVVRIIPETRTVVVGRKEELLRKELVADQANWLVEPPSKPIRAAVKVRYRSPAVPATVELLDENRFRVIFDEPCFAVTPGQAAVCYHEDRVLGGGWIVAE